MWSATRWQTYRLMEAQVGTKALRENGINSPTDLIQFPWDKEPYVPISDKDRDDLLAEMAAMNAALEKSNEGQKDESQ